MSFAEDLKALGERAVKSIDHLPTEEAVKQSLILPFLNLLGYNVFDFNEVMPEYTADLGTKKGEKVDYAILHDGDPHIIIEAKGPESKLEDHKNQLYRYFNALGKAKFAVLTNGVCYQFFSDLDEPNKMDINPFLTVDFQNLREQAVEELEKFHKKKYNVETILSTASELKYTTQIKEYMAKQIKNPDEEFVKTVLRTVYSGKLMPSVLERFTPIVKKSITVFINELVNDKIKAALEGGEPRRDTNEFDEPELSPKRKIITTEEELEAFVMIKFLLKDSLKNNTLTYKDTASYFAVLLNNKVSCWICRIRLGSKKNIIEFKDGETIEIESIQDIEKYKDKLIANALSISSGQSEIE